MAEKETAEKKTDEGVSLPLRVEGVFHKIKKSVDGLVDGYCRLTKIEPLEARDIVSKKAASSMKRGSYGRAIDHYNRLINMGEEDASIYYNLGVCCERENMDEEAEKAYKKAIAMDKDCEDAHYRLGLLAIKNDDPRAAVKHLGALDGKNSKSFDIAYNLGVAHDKLKDHKKAVESFKKAIAADPNYAKAYKRLGYTYDATGDHEEAVECFKKAMELEEV